MHTLTHRDYPDITIACNSDWSGDAIVTFKPVALPTQSARTWTVWGRELLSGKLTDDGLTMPVHVAAQAVAMAVRSDCSTRAICAAEQLLELEP